MDSTLGKMLDAQKNRGELQPYLGNSNVRWGSFDLSDLASMRFERHEEDRYGLRAGDLVICEGGEPGRCAIWRRSTPKIKIQKALHRVRVKESLHGEFLYYWFLMAGRSEALEPYFTGTTIKHLTGRALTELLIPLPPLERQRSIGDTLKSLDDKIELNRRVNETLEAMAQAIFQDWFVDFGPVRRKMEGATDPVAIMGGLTPDPARAAELAALFPATLSEDGLPDGWSEVAIGETADIAGGSTPSTSNADYWSPAEHRWATPKDLSGMNDLALFDTSRRVSASGLATITSGLLPVGTVLLSSRAPIGYLAIAQEPVAINQGFIALKPHGAAGSAYLYLWCKAHMDTILANANGSTFQEISKKNFRPILSAMPPNEEILNAFSEVADPLIARIVSAARESAILAETREYLLPRLMSGQIRVTA